MSVVLILVAGGNATTREMMRLALQAQGYAVLEAADSENTFRLVAEQSLALVLLDCTLSDADGFAVGRRLRALAPGLPVVAIAGWAQADEARLLTGGFLDVLVKPVDAARLVDTVARHVGRDPLRTPEPGKTILLAEDDPTQRKLAQLVLATAGFQVVVAEDGEAALKLAARQKPDLFLSDVLMPRLDGFALCKAIRSDPNLARIPIVLMSAHYLEEEDRELAARFGAGYVSRTGGFDDVLRAVIDAIAAPSGDLAVAPAEEVQAEHLRRIARQLERQASIGVSLMRRVSSQASALSVLDSLSESLARQIDPETALLETLSSCLEDAGLSVGAILLRADNGQFAVKAYLGSKAVPDWDRYGDSFQRAVDEGGCAFTARGADRSRDELLAALGVTGAVIAPMIARGETLGVLLLASSTTELFGAEGDSALRAARSMAIQLAQALALSRTVHKLTSAEQRYRALLENAHDGIAISTPGGILLEVNLRMEQLLGLPRERSIGRPLADFVATKKGGGVNASVAPAAPLGQGTAFVPTVDIARPDGSVVQVEFSSTEVEVGGNRYVFNVGRDVSERRRLEEQLRQSQKMDAIGQLAGGIAHDFNNLLSVILSYCDLGLEQLSADAPIRHDLQEIRQAGSRAADLTRQLLMFSRQQVIEPKVVDLNDLLVGIDRMLQRLLGSDIELVSMPAPHLGRVRVDPGSIEQVIMNLTINARDAMPTGGKLTLETANVVVDERYAREHLGAKPGPHVMLSVTDTGTGMDRATQARIFEPFYTTKPTGKGTGLGLATVFGIVQQSGGSIWVYSEPGHGTTFKVYLPRVEQFSDSIPPASAPKASLGSETLLLVEDDDQVRAVARSILQKSGYHVLEARNAGEALLQAEGHSGPIHLLLTDVVMPQISGPELARRLAVARPEMKLLCMSGYTDDSIVRHGALAASIPYLQKPFTPEGLAARVREVLDAPARFSG